MNSMFIEDDDVMALSRSWSKQSHVKAPWFGTSDSIFFKSDHSYFAITEKNYNVVGDFKQYLNQDTTLKLENIIMS